MSNCQNIIPKMSKMSEMSKKKLKCQERKYEIKC